MTLRLAAHNMGYVEGLIDEHESSEILVVRTLEQIMADLLHRMISVREQEEADVALEQDLWRQATEQNVVWARHNLWLIGHRIISRYISASYYSN